MEMGSTGCVLTKLGCEQLTMDSTESSSRRSQVLLWGLQLLGEFTLHGIHVGIHTPFCSERPQSGPAWTEDHNHHWQLYECTWRCIETGWNRYRTMPSTHSRPPPYPQHSPLSISPLSLSYYPSPSRLVCSLVELFLSLLFFHLPSPLVPSLSSGRQYFWLLLSGQSVSAITNALIWGGPSLLSSVWFPPSERATATAIAGATCSQVILYHISLELQFSQGYYQASLYLNFFSEITASSALLTCTITPIVKTPVIYA